LSLILDALNRSRRDADPVPGIATIHAGEERGELLRRYLPWLALGVALPLIAWLLWERREPAPPPDNTVAELSRNIGSALTSVKTELKERAAVAQQQQAPQTTAAVVPPPAAAAPAPTPAPTPTPAPAPASAAAAAPDLAPAAPPEPAASPAARQTAPASPAEGLSPDAAEQAAIAALYERAGRPELEPEPEPQPAAAAARREEPVDIERMLRQAQEQVADGDLQDHAVPMLASLSQQVKDDIPTIHYLRHDYSGTAGRSSVLLNGQTLRVGGSPAPGMRVEEILPDSVVLSYKGTQFRLRALNSWVNL